MLVVVSVVVVIVVDAVVEIGNNEKNQMQYNVKKRIWSQRINLKNNGVENVWSDTFNFMRPKPTVETDFFSTNSLKKGN